jgi:hypothetical protein
MVRHRQARWNIEKEKLIMAKAMTAATPQMNASVADLRVSLKNDIDTWPDSMLLDMWNYVASEKERFATAKSIGRIEISPDYDMKPSPELQRFPQPHIEKGVKWTV